MQSPEEHLTKPVQDQQEQAAKAALQEELSAQIEAAKAQVQAELAKLMAQPVSADVETQRQALEAQLASLDSQLLAVATGSLVDLAQVARSLPAQLATALSQAGQIAQSSAAEIAHNICEMTHEQIIVMEQRHAEASAQFQFYEAMTFDRMEAWASQSGTDITPFRDMQRKLKAEYDTAKAKGDSLGMAEADALRATNLRLGLQQSGAPDDAIRKAEEEEQKRERDYLEQVALRAKAVAEDRGLSGDALETFVEGKVTQAQSGLEKRRGEMEEELGIASNPKRNAAKQLDALRQAATTSQDTDQIARTSEGDLMANTALTSGQLKQRASEVKSSDNVGQMVAGLSLTVDAGAQPAFDEGLEVARSAPPVLDLLDDPEITAPKSPAATEKPGPSVSH